MSRARVLMLALACACQGEIQGTNDAGDPPAGGDRRGDLGAGDSAAGDRDPVAGDPVAGDPVAGDPVAGDPVAGDPGLPDCTIVVDSGTALQTAADDADPGDVICLRAGNYPPFRVTRSGSELAPIVFRAFPGERRLARITRNDHSLSQGLKVEDAHDIVLDGLWVDQVNQGIFILRSDRVVARDNKVSEIGQECMRFKWSDFGTFSNNEISACGRRWEEGYNGEGIYVGSGDEPGDDTHGATIIGNHIWDTKDEGIEFKGATYDCVVAHNVVHDIVCKDGGGIVVSTPDFDDPGMESSGHVVHGNIAYNVQTRTPYMDGNGFNIRRGSLVYNNIAYDNQHYGMRIDDKRDLDGDIFVYHNTFFANGNGAVGIFDSAVVDLRNNLGPSSTGNAEASANLFVNATDRDFHLADGVVGAIDAGVDVGIDVDREGTSRPQRGGFDLGAYELP